MEYMKDALEGTNIVSASVAASTITTCVVFIPLAMLTGMTGQVLGPLGYTIVFCMMASLLSAISVVPLCYMLYRPKERDSAFVQTGGKTAERISQHNEKDSAEKEDSYGSFRGASGFIILSGRSAGYGADGIG